MELPLNALRAFALVYRHGGVRAAARELGMAHSSVSRHLGELARWLGVPLLQSGAGRAGLAFTPQGEALAKAVCAGLRDIEQAVAAVRETRPAHAVALSTTPSFALHWLLPRLPAFEKAQPKIELSVLVEQKLEGFADGRVDLAVRMGRGPWPGLHCEPLMGDVLYPVMSPAYWREHGRPSTSAQLAGLRLLHDRDPQAAWESWRRAHGPAGLALQGGARYASSDLVLRAAQQGQGVALARHRLVAGELASGTLLRPMGALEVAIGDAYWLVRAPAVRPRAAVAAVIDWLRWQAAAP
ncbi:LysR substrate-binding domain-containing protein [Frateuria hangzhouensis]|uniref:LysR substrate-binding domain-containing protein n=1 Tax=Frateuria hangzhouensis TaxID=2995589 RepID=UPI0022609FC4|nr:LysR substrate-binding domain-containing protein [Frateuria sp. STR12]MCX7513561.1 LysR substrate-binding domain-containing protein [Frateuria sp. STR12]